MRRFLLILFGLATHVLFAVTVWYVYFFLKGTEPPGPAGPLSIDVLLCLQFALVHSALLHPRVREPLSRYVPPPFYGLMYCVATSLGLLATIFAWQSSPIVYWRLSGMPQALITAGYLGSWLLLLYSIGLTGFGWQTGFTPWWHWLRGLPPPARNFRPRGLYLWLRHPVYVGFLGLIWFTPVMTADRAILTGIWSTYVFVGSWLKDRRLAHYIGTEYREYQARVPGYPGMFAGPLARLPEVHAAPRRASKRAGQALGAE